MKRREDLNNNKGFSLVELIVVIAIMAVLVGVLAPQFIKYVESARRSTDITNAANIESSVVADMADGLIEGSGCMEVSEDNFRDLSLGEVPTIKGNVTDRVGGNFFVGWNSNTGEVSVVAEEINGYGGADQLAEDGVLDLTTDSGAQSYKNAD